MNNDEISINVRVYDKVYPMKVLRSEEYIVRKAVKNINDKINKYLKQYQGFDMQTILSMIVIDVFVEHLHDKEDEQKVGKEIQQLVKEINNGLKDKIISS